MKYDLSCFLSMYAVLPTCLEKENYGFLQFDFLSQKTYPGVLSRKSTISMFCGKPWFNTRKVFMAICIVTSWIRNWNSGGV